MGLFQRKSKPRYVDVWVCPECGWTIKGANIQPWELPVHHNCKGKKTGAVKEKNASEGFQQLVRKYCENCEFYRADGTCTKRKSCKESHICPEGKWGWGIERESKVRLRKSNRRSDKTVGEIEDLLEGKQSYRTQLPITLGIITPGLKSAGAERWVASMTGAFDSEVIKVTSVLTTGKDVDVFDEELVRQIESNCELISLVGKNELNESVRKFLENDVLLMWGRAGLPPVLQSYEGVLIYVSHSSSESGRGMVNKAVDHVDHIVGVSQASLDGIWSGVDATVLHNGIDLERCKPKRSREEVRREWGVGKSDVLVVFVGRPHPDKHPELVAQACNLLSDSYVSVFIGEFGRSEEQKLEDCCVRSTFPGWTDHIGDVLAAVDVFCLPSDHEAMSLSICEAWAAGVPVVTTPVGAVPELERLHGKLVKRIPVGVTPSDLGDAIENAFVFGTEGEYRKRAKRVIQDHYSIEAMARRWTSFLLAVTR